MHYFLSYTKIPTLMTSEALTSTFPFSDQISQQTIDNLKSQNRPEHKCIHQALQLDNIFFVYSLPDMKSILPLMDHIVQLNFT